MQKNEIDAKIKESVSKNISNPKQLAKIFPLMEKVINSAVGIESHQNRYYFDTDTTAVHELLSGYVEGKYFVPVRFGIKEGKSGNTIYVIINQDAVQKNAVIKNKKADMLESAPAEQSSVEARPTSTFDISISDFVKKVKVKK